MSVENDLDGLGLDIHRIPARTPTERLLTAADLSERFGMSKDWIYAEIRANRIPHVRLGRYVRFRWSEVEAWLTSQRRGPKLP